MPQGKRPIIFRSCQHIVESTVNWSSVPLYAIMGERLWRRYWTPLKHVLLGHFLNSVSLMVYSVTNIYTYVLKSYIYSWHATTPRTKEGYQGVSRQFWFSSYSPVYLLNTSTNMCVSYTVKNFPNSNWRHNLLLYTLRGGGVPLRTY